MPARGTVAIRGSSGPGWVLESDPSSSLSSSKLLVAANLYARSSFRASIDHLYAGDFFCPTIHQVHLYAQGRLTTQHILCGYIVTLGRLLLVLAVPLHQKRFSTSCGRASVEAGFVTGAVSSLSSRLLPRSTL